MSKGVSVGGGVIEAFAVVYIIRFQCLRREQNSIPQGGNSLSKDRENI